MARPCKLDLVATRGKLIDSKLKSSGLQAHPALVAGTPENEAMNTDGSGELVAEAVEVHLSAGDALLFVDCMLHG